MSDDAGLVIVGAGPCGLAAAISAQRAGLKPLVIESKVAVSAIAAYPAYVRFFSTAEKLAIGELPFVIATAFGSLLTSTVRLRPARTRSS